MPGFPRDLHESQLALHRTWSEYLRFTVALVQQEVAKPPEEASLQTHSGGQPADTPSFNDERIQHTLALVSRLRELGDLVTAHPFWKTHDADAHV
ncbi:hypothetical protein ACGFYA_29420 [Streptomyces sp. NPDC048305]|uniref:hypothetical protein n=1 Tax=Streptomyces sp. NPDC048305 TaxID=3365532 RepID=UPI00371BC726